MKGNSTGEQQVILDALGKVYMEAHEVRAVRRDLGFTQREFATLLGVRPGTLCRWERHTGVGGPARVLLMLLKRGPWVLRQLGLNYPAREPQEEADDGGVERDVSDVQPG